MNFDRTYKRAKKGFGITFIVVLVFKLALLGGIIWGAVAVTNHVTRVGLKNIIEDVWEGTGE